VTGLFDPDALAAVVHRTLVESPDIPDGAHGAFLLVADQESAKAVVAVRVADGWKIEAMIETPWTDVRRVQVGVAVKGIW
jgi:hypothetical protein